MSFVIILKRAKPTQARLVRFDAQPSWGDLTSKIAEISLNNVAVIFIDEAEGELTLTNEQDL